MAASIRLSFRYSVAQNLPEAVAPGVLSILLSRLSTASFSQSAQIESSSELFSRRSLSLSITIVLLADLGY